jgi:hypothetical protein
MLPATATGVGNAIAFLELALVVVKGAPTARVARLPRDPDAPSDGNGRRECHRILGARARCGEERTNGEVVDVHDIATLQRRGRIPGMHRILGAAGSSDGLAELCLVVAFTHGRGHDQWLLVM